MIPDLIQRMQRRISVINSELDSLWEQRGNLPEEAHDSYLEWELDNRADMLSSWINDLRIAMRVIKEMESQ